MKINKKLILLSTISISLLATGCSSKTIQVNKRDIVPYTAPQVETVESEQVDRKIAFLSVPKLEMITPELEMRTAQTVSSWKDKLSSNNNNKASECSGDNCMAFIVEPKTSSKSDEVVGDETITPADEPYFASNVTVQVGAFRHFLGAKKYAKRYSLLDNQYSVDIKKETKDSAPIYRVQVNGFLSNKEAKNFINKYSSQGAFLVQK